MTRFRSGFPLPWRLLGLALLCAAGALAGVAAHTAHGGFGMLWVPAGVAAAVTLLTPPRQWPRYLAVTVGAQVPVLAVFAPDGWVSGTTLPQHLTMAALAAGTAAAAGVLVPRATRTGRVSVDSVGEAFAFVAVAVIAAPAATALAGDAILAAWGAPLSAHEVFHWWARDALGVLLVVPVALAGHAAVRTRQARIEGIAVLAAGAVVTAVMFIPGLSPDEAAPAMPYAVFPLVAWTALRFSPRHVTLLVAAFAVGLPGLSAASLGPFAASRASGHLNTEALQAFLAALAGTGLLLTATIQERRRAAAELAAREERHRTVLAAAGDAVLLQDADGRVLSSNPAADRLLAALPGDGPWHLRPAFMYEDGAAVPSEKHPTARAFASRGTYRETPLGVVLGDGTTAWFVVTAAALERDPAGAGGVVVTTLSDVTAMRRRAQEEAALRHLATAAAPTASPRLFDFVAEQAARLLGARGGLVRRFSDDGPGEVLGRHGDTPDGAEGVVAAPIALRRQLWGTVAVFGAAPPHTGDDDRAARLRRLADLAGLVLGAAEDRTVLERHSLEQAGLRRLATAAASEADEEHLLEVASAELRLLLGAERVAVVEPGQAAPPGALTAPLAAPGGALGTLAVVAPESPREAGDAVARFAAELAGAIVARRSRERARALEEELQRATRLEAVGHLAAGIAHEINTPVQFIGNSTEFLDDAFGDILELVDRLIALSPEPGEDHADATRRIEREADLAFLRSEVPAALERTRAGAWRVAEIVRAMKEVSRPAGNALEPSDVGRALRNTAVVAHHETKRVAEVSVEVPDTLPPVTCDIGRLSQVFLNLVVNAAHAVEERHGQGGAGRIVIAAEADGDEMVVTVADNGPGIPAHARDRVFDQFFTTKDVGRGTGQGLSIARSIIESHGGSLTFVTAFGEGTTFRVAVPLAGPAGGSVTPGDAGWAASEAGGAP